MDHQTASGKRPAFAKVLVEIGAEDSLPRSINIGCEGNVFAQVIEYAWKPKACFTCRTFNHSAGSCPRLQEKTEQKVVVKSKENWVRKTTSTKSQSTEPEIDDLVNENVIDDATQARQETSPTEAQESTIEQGNVNWEKQNGKAS